MAFAIVQGNIVKNVVSGLPSADSTVLPSQVTVVLNPGEACEPGATYSAGSSPRFIIPPRQRIWTAYEFLNRFTDSELMAIRSQSATDAILWKFLTFATAAQEVVRDDPVTVQGMDYLVSQNIITQARKAEILGG
jgi:hypothetical protein